MTAPRYRRSPSWILAPVVEGESSVLIPILPGDQGTVTQADLSVIYQVNDTGALLWRELEAPCTENDLAAALEREFDEQSVDPGGLRRDVEDFVSELVSLGALQELSRD